MIPTNILFVLVLLVAGYLFCTLFHRTHWALARSSGYHTFLLAAVTGFLILATVFLIRIPIVIFGPDFNLTQSIIATALADIPIASSTIVFIELAAGSILLAVATPYLFYGLAWTFSGATRHGMLEGTFVNSPGTPEFTSLIYSSFSQGLPVLFTLSDGKVFIGYPMSVRAEDFNDIMLLPTVSGYRRRDTLELELTTNYKKVLDQMMDQHAVDPEAFLITIPTREVVHAHLFDINHNERFQIS
ncbi:MAG: hypothetical protein WEB57_09955 [Pseudohongiellaceae bacterium]